MERSLSVLLPIHNGQSTLAHTVGEILEVLPELTSHFELVIIDDGSTDATIEVADELAEQYPQLRAVRHTTTMGHHAAVRTGLQHSSGEIICVGQETGGQHLTDILQQWHDGEVRKSSIHKSHDRVSGPGFRILSRVEAESIGQPEIAKSAAPLFAPVGPASPNYLSCVRAYSLGDR